MKVSLERAAFLEERKIEVEILVNMRYFQKVPRGCFCVKFVGFICVEMFDVLLPWTLLLALTSASEWCSTQSSRMYDSRIIRFRDVERGRIESFVITLAAWIFVENPFRKNKTKEIDML